MKAPLLSLHSPAVLLLKSISRATYMCSCMASRSPRLICDTTNIPRAISLCAASLQLASAKSSTHLAVPTNKSGRLHMHIQRSQNAVIELRCICIVQAKARASAPSGSSLRSSMTAGCRERQYPVCLFSLNSSSRVVGATADSGMSDRGTSCSFLARGAVSRSRQSTALYAATVLGAPWVLCANAGMAQIDVSCRTPRKVL